MKEREREKKTTSEENRNVRKSRKKFKLPNRSVCWYGTDTHTHTEDAKDQQKKINNFCKPDMNIRLVFMPKPCKQPQWCQTKSLFDIDHKYHAIYMLSEVLLLCLLRGCYFWSYPKQLNNTLFVIFFCFCVYKQTRALSHTHIHQHQHQHQPGYKYTRISISYM